MLREKNLKVTPQRLIILEYLNGHSTHPTTDNIYQDLKTNNPSLSKTTVYNSLDILEKHGIIQSITISGLEHRYDFRHGMHHHVLCKKCGRSSRSGFLRGASPLIPVPRLVTGRRGGPQATSPGRVHRLGRWEDRPLHAITGSSKHWTFSPCGVADGVGLEVTLDNSRLALRAA